MRRASSSPATASTRALPCAPSVRTGTCQPCQDRASTPLAWSAMASSPLVTCSPVATTVSYSRASCSGDSSWHQRTSPLVDARHGRDHHRDLVPGLHLALHPARNGADTVEIGDGGAAELHHDAGHVVSGALPAARTRPRRAVAAAGRACKYGRAEIPAPCPHRNMVRASRALERRRSVAWRARRRGRQRSAARRSARRSPSSTGSPRAGGTRAARWRRSTP